MAGEILSFSIRDYSREKSGFGTRVGVVTAGTLPGLLTQIGTFRAATQAVILGTIQGEQLIAFNSRLTNAVPTDPNAQRERKWLVTYADNTEYFDAPTNSIPNEGFGRIFNLEIPTANLTSALLIDNTDEADLTATPWVNWIAAFEAMGRSPHGGVPEVLLIEAVGRNI